MKAAMAVLVCAVVLSACSTPTKADDLKLCTAAQVLSGAITGSRSATIADLLGNPSNAEALASTARLDAEQANSFLKAITTPAVLQGTAWQQLSATYLHTAQAANSMLPGFENTHGIAAEELTQAETALQAAGAALPSSCVVPIPPTLTDLPSPTS